MVFPSHYSEASILLRIYEGISQVAARAPSKRALSAELSILVPRLRAKKRLISVP